MAYITNTDIGNNLGVTVASSDYVTMLISAVTDYVERLCGGGVFERRQFEVANGNTQKLYDGNGLTKMLIEDVRTIQSLEVDGVQLVEGEDYLLYPLNSTVKEWIELIQPDTYLARNPRIQHTNPYVFYEGQAVVKVTGQHGYSLTPPELIKLVTAQLCGAILKEKIGDASLKELNSQSLGEYTVSYSKISEVANSIGAEKMLADYIRKPIASSRKQLSGYIQAS